MYELTKLALLYLIERKKKKNDLSISFSEVVDFIIRRIPIITGIIANESPPQVQDEVKTAIRQLNFYMKRMYNVYEECLSIDKNKIIVKKQCAEILVSLLERTRERVKDEATLMALYANTILSVE